MCWKYDSTGERSQVALRDSLPDLWSRVVWRRLHRQFIGKYAYAVRFQANILLIFACINACSFFFLCFTWPSASFTALGRYIVYTTLGDGLPSQKSRHCLGGWVGVGGSDSCLNFVEGFVHMHWRALKGDHLSHKSDIPPKVFLIPQKKIIQLHIFNLISTLLSKKNVASRIHALLWAKSLRMPGLGEDQPNLGNAWILGTSGTATPP